MRVCLVTPYDLSLDGGVNKHALYLGAALRALDDHVEVIGPASGAPPDAPDVTCFGAVVTIQGNESDNRIGLLTSPLALRRYMRSRRFDVLHVHEPLVPLIAYYALLVTTAPARVCTFHRYTEQEAPLTRTVRRWMEFSLRPYQRGIAVSEAAARYARVGWHRALAVIPNGVDTRYFAPPEDGAESAGASGEPAPPETAFRLLFIGQWTDRRKGLPVLLEAVARLRADGIDARLEVVGKGDERVAVPEGIPGVRFHGRVPEAMLRQHLYACHALVAPSTGQESFGIVLVEGMAAGRPVVACDIEGCRQVASPAGAVLVPPGDAAALAAALAALWRDPARRRAMGQHNLAEVKQYDWANLAPRIREVYAQALGESRSRRPAAAAAETAKEGAGVRLLAEPT